MCGSVCLQSLGRPTSKVLFSSWRNSYSSLNAVFFQLCGSRSTLICLLFPKTGSGSVSISTKCNKLDFFHFNFNILSEILEIMAPMPLTRRKKTGIGLWIKSKINLWFFNMWNWCNWIGIKMKSLLRIGIDTMPIYKILHTMIRHCFFGLDPPKSALNQHYCI